MATTKAAIVTTAATLAAMMPSQNGFANAVRQQVQQLPNVAMSRANAAGGMSNGAIPSAVLGGLRLSPKRLATPGTGSNASTSVSPSKAGAVRALFSEKGTNSTQDKASTAKSTVTYTQASMAKTKVVTSTMPTTFAAKVDNRTTSGGNPGTPKMQPKLHGMGVQNSKSAPQPGKSEPQPLPIKSTPGNMQGQGQQRGGTTSNMSGGLHMSSAPAEYSPFNNLFSQLQERVIGKKEDQMNFASVAAAGVVPQERPLSSGGSVPVPPKDMHSDPNLIAKAPGYKAPGQRTTSPQVNELEPNKAPGYKGGFSPQQSQSDPLSEPHKSPNQFPGLNHIGHGPHGHGHPGAGMNMDAFRVPPPFIPGDYPDPSRIPGYRLSAAQMNAPRSASSTPASMGGQSPKPMDILSQFGARDEYSMPNQPMTLPRIESTLNPNAPDFTSRTDFNPRDFGVGGPSRQGFLHAQQMVLHHHKQQQQHVGRNQDGGPPSQPGRNQPQPPPPQHDMRVPPPTGPPPAGAMLNQQNLNAVLQSASAGNLVLPPGSTNLGTVPDFTQGGGGGNTNFLNPALMGATGTIPVATVGVVTPQPRQYQGSPMQRSNSAPGSHHPTPSKGNKSVQ